jgi:hypothetical protein
MLLGGEPTLHTTNAGAQGACLLHQRVWLHQVQGAVKLHSCVSLLLAMVVAPLGVQLPLAVNSYRC